MLSGTEIMRRLLDHESGLAITPLIDVNQIGYASVDLRLGPDFIVTRRATGLAAFDPARVDEIEQRVREYQEYVRRPVGSAFYLHPGEFAVARTLEYLTVPAGTAAQVDGRSSWGRLGLIIQTAPLVQPKFEGTVTLELANVGTVPLVLYVGLRVAQVMFYDLLPSSPASSPAEVRAPTEVHSPADVRLQADQEGAKT
jgi:dCTP deaminase